MDAEGYSILKSGDKEMDYSTPLRTDQPDKTFSADTKSDTPEIRIVINEVERKADFQSSGPTTSESSSDHSQVALDMRTPMDRNEPVNLLYVFGMYCNGYNETVQNISSSKWTVPLYILFMMFPLAALVLGLVARDECPFIPSAATMSFMIGLVGIIGSLSMIIQVLNVFGAATSKTVRVVNVICYMVLIILIASITLAFTKAIPSFEPKSPNYCNRIFYTYIFWFNWVGLLIMLMMGMLYIPGCCRPDLTN